MKLYVPRLHLRLLGEYGLGEELEHAADENNPKEHIAFKQQRLLALAKRGRSIQVALTPSALRDLKSALDYHFDAEQTSLEEMAGESGIETHIFLSLLVLAGAIGRNASLFARED